MEADVAVKKKINWKKGSSELISMTICLPLLLFIIYAMVGVIQLGLMRQTLEYTVYASTRAAVVCDNPTDAQLQARNIAVTTLANTTFGGDIDNIQVNLKLVGGTSQASGAGASASSMNGIRWEKGALLQCEIVVPMFNFSILGKDSMRTTLFMMVEKPARTYYW